LIARTTRIHKPELHEFFENELHELFTTN
jgi:hypothetical protein